MSIQAAVTRVHHERRCHPVTLATSVQDAWDKYLSPNAFKNVHGRLRIVLSCILEDNGGNSLVESKRGKLFRDATIPENPNDRDENKEDESDNDAFDDIDSVGDD